MKLPDFLIIGAMKAGTTTLYRDLLTNPAIFFPIDKEPNNLTSDEVLTDEGLREYAALYDKAESDQVCGDASTTYAKLPDIPGVPERARNVLGQNLKIIYIVRDPIARIISHHRNLFTNETIDESDINIAIRTCPELLDYSRYAMQITPWRELFGSEQVLIIPFEQYTSDRQTIIGRASEFLGIPPRPDLIKTDMIYNRSDQKPVARGVWRFVQQSWLYRSLLRPLLSPELKDAIRRRLLSTAPPSPLPPTSETLHFITDQLAEDLSSFQAMMAEDPAPWNTRMPIDEYYTE